MLTTPNFTCDGNATALPTDALQNWFVVNTLCNALGAVSSLLLLAAIFSESRLHKSGAQLLIAHLILIDLVICAIHSPLNAVSTFLGTTESVPNELFCSLVHYAFMGTMYGGQWTAAFLAFNRFTASYLPHRYKSLFAGKIHLWMIVVAWNIGFLLNFCFFFGAGGRFGPIPPWNGCGILPDENSNIYAWTVAVGLYAPLVLGFVFYLLIFIRAVLHHFRPSRISMTSISVDRRRVTKRKRLLIAKMLCLSSLTVCMFYLPHAVYMSSYFEVISCNPELQLWLRELFYAGYAVNPLVFFAMSTDYRKALRKLITKITLDPVSSDRQPIFTTTKEARISETITPAKRSGEEIL